MTPGIRPAGAEAADQSRVVTPAGGDRAGRRLSRRRAADFRCRRSAGRRAGDRCGNGGGWGRQLSARHMMPRGECSVPDPFHFADEAAFLFGCGLRSGIGTAAVGTGVSVFCRGTPTSLAQSAGRSASVSRCFPFQAWPGFAGGLRLRDDRACAPASANCPPPCRSHRRPARAVFPTQPSAPGGQAIRT